MSYITLEELYRSDTAKQKGIDNTPDEVSKNNLKQLVEKVLDPIRERWGRPIYVNSGYRCPKLNKLVGGVPTSQHALGQAADIRTASNTLEENNKLFEMIKSSNILFDQLIFEYGDRKKGPKWVHVSYKPNGRKQVLYIGV